jgi:hypothetical protein
LVAVDLYLVFCLLSAEVIYLLFGAWATKVDRRIQGMPDERYNQQVLVPLMALGLSVPLSIGANLVTADGVVGLVGMLTVIAAILAGALALSVCAAGHKFRRTRTARLRRALAAVGEAVRPDPGVSAPAGARLHAGLARIGQLGDLLTTQADELHWTAAFWQAKRWLQAVILTAAVLPLAAAVVLASRTPTLTEAFRPALFLVGLLASLTLAVALRATRCRRTLRELGTELRTTSDALLARLAATVPASPALTGWRRGCAHILNTLLRRVEQAHYGPEVITAQAIELTATGARSGSHHPTSGA